VRTAVRFSLLATKACTVVKLLISGLQAHRSAESACKQYYLCRRDTLCLPTIHGGRGLVCVRKNL